MNDDEANEGLPENPVAGTVLPDGSRVGDLPDLTDIPLSALREMDPELRADATARIVAQVKKSGGGVDPCSRDECGA